MKLHEIVISDGPDSVLLSEVETAQGKPMALSKLIQRAWGWPRSASKIAADYLSRKGKDLEPIPVSGGGLWPYQSRIIDECNLTKMLIKSMRVSASKNAKHSERTFHTVSLCFVGYTPESYEVREISDDGVVNGIVNLVAMRFGVPTDTVRNACSYGGEDGHLEVEVDIDDLFCDQELDSDQLKSIHSGLGVVK